MQLYWPSKRIAEVLDYKLNWSNVLESDTIEVSVWEIVTEDSELVIENDSNTQSVTVVWLSGGITGSFKIKNTITTGDGRTHVAIITLPVKA